MTEKYIRYSVAKEQRTIDEGEIEPGGYLSKFWVNHPQLGRSLVKLDEDTAPGWSEKRSSAVLMVSIIERLLQEGSLRTGNTS